MTTKKRIFIAGHNGMVGSAIFRRLQDEEDINIIVRSRKELDLTDQQSVARFFSTQKIDEVYMAGAKVGGIYANTTFPAEFIYQNLIVEANVIHQAWVGGVKKLMFLGSSCIYPKFADQPMKEEALLTGMLEPTNEPYAIAKIAGIKLCESYNRQYGESHGIDYRSVMPTNLYGPGDNYHPKNSHVIPALIRRFYEAKMSNLSSVDVWGSGNARREFLFVDDLAEATIYIHNLNKESYSDVTSSMVSHINIGYGSDVSIADLVEIIVDVVGFKGEIKFDASMPDGTPRKLMSNEKIQKLGWKPSIDLRAGLELTVKEFINSVYN